MDDRQIQMHLGLGALIASALLLLVAIPNWVSSPSNVPNIVLSPLFWPNTIAGFTGLVGIGLLLASFRRSIATGDEPAEAQERRAALGRLLMVAVMMGLTVYALPRLGLVWTSMLVFASTALLVRTNHPKTALLCAIVIPLVLYAFFAHVAGVAIPQGLFVRLP